MAAYIQQGNTIIIGDSKIVSSYKQLPAGYYTVKFNEFAGEFFLEIMEPFTVPDKIYGDTPDLSKRILTTFLNRDTSTGAIFTGEKGSGKSLLSKNISSLANEIDIPTIVVSEPHAGSGFSDFLQSIDQQCVVLFDEFEKVYEFKKQEQLLTLLDGTVSMQKLFLFTCNNSFLLNENLTNRPGRVYYYINFDGIEPHFIREYCEDNLKDKQHIDELCAIGASFSKFNFDMLSAIVEEMNRYNEKPTEVLKVINARPENSSEASYKISLFKDGQPVTQHYHPKTIRGNPLQVYNDVTIWVTMNSPNDNVGDVPEEATASDADDLVPDCDGEIRIRVDGSCVTEVDKTTGSIIMEKHGYKVIFEKERISSFDYSQVF